MSGKVKGNDQGHLLLSLTEMKGGTGGVVEFTGLNWQERWGGQWVGQSRENLCSWMTVGDGF